MKTIKIKFLTISYITFFLVFIACEKENNQDLLNPKTQFDRQIHNKLFTISEHYVVLLREVDFKNYIYKQVEKQFDGDYNVLLEREKE